MLIVGIGVHRRIGLHLLEMTKRLQLLVQLKGEARLPEAALSPKLWQRFIVHRMPCEICMRVYRCVHTYIHTYNPKP